ncbi:DUF3141 domain-containing protein [Cupriavidus pinatubonensis]|uniref:Poly(3-hydroxyalkanoate) synthetase n=1 Tax=Cupriavidus pinatubonensis TaxID=248026 RepID=A0ABM8XUH9_9BURK|nr:DUF3141 domain-containing protein [Cupriavidus pinatubonensis]CAG9184024.1 hypothetical protein LMG23994_05290 [Cupriavidus pinatubonensis]
MAANGTTAEATTGPAMTANPAALAQYLGDLAWRSVATAQILQQRAENMKAHEAAGMPPLLHFEAEEVLDGHTLQPPTNYRLLRVTRCGTDALEQYVRRAAAPVIVVDPRAGHGPGIGGFHRDSEVGMALREGHPVYFVVFDPQPVEGQTMGAVVETLARFLDTVAARHRGKPPIVYGNCQGGWAVALALSHCERQAGLAVLNGSPLSYWAGEPGVNPMRLLAGFTGGVWPAHLLADLGAGTFDGAWLVQNFEALRPEGVWKKYETLWAHPERERDRFLGFERWWNGFYFLGREELLAIVNELFIGNKVEHGEVVVDCGCRADLTRIHTPLLIFSSYGDNITPPHQALAWLRSVYRSTAELVAAQQRVVYLLHPKVGHLGIFVSADIALREHRAILHYAEKISQLPPGLYEMQLAAATDQQGVAAASFVSRRLEDLQFEPQPPGFDRVQQLSADLDDIYTKLVSPWIRLLGSKPMADFLVRSHPMRVSRQVWATSLPLGGAELSFAAGALEEAKLDDAARERNPWYRAERAASAWVEQSIAAWRTLRDEGAEIAFRQLYGSDGPAAVTARFDPSQVAPPASA